MTELEPLADEDWPANLDALRQGFAGKLNVYRVMAHHPALLLAWQTLRNHVVLHSVLTQEQRELVILRVGDHWQAGYEWGQHVVRGRQAGLSDARICSARAPTQSLPAGPDRLLLECVDHLLLNARLPIGHKTELLEQIGAPATLDLCATIGMYTTLAYIVNSFAVPLETEMVAELLRHPLMDA